MIHMTSPNIAYVGDVVPDLTLDNRFMRVREVTGVFGGDKPLTLVNSDAEPERVWDDSVSWTQMTLMRRLGEVMQRERC